VDAIGAILFEPVGCLAEFRPDEFEAAAGEIFQRGSEESVGGNTAYWRLLTLIEKAHGRIGTFDVTRLEELELSAVAHADLYEDVVPSLEKIRGMGIKTHLVSSLSRHAIDAFLERFSLGGLFDGTIAREGGVLAAPLRQAIEATALDPRRIIYLVDTAEALNLAKRLELNAMLMINDYDEGRALAERSPAGGIVSLAELPRALELIEQRTGLTASARLPRKPFELFECE
jgi:phosphoglycolate phosphatase-like HAD superfamily hydrolase